MKKLAMFFLMIILFGKITAQDLGWLDKGRYSEIKVAADPIFAVKFTNDGQKIITLNGSIVNIWDTKSGKLIKRHDYGLEDFNCSISSDDSTVVFSKSWLNDFLGRDYLDFETIIYNLQSDSLIKSFYSENFDVCYNPYNNRSNSKSDYDYKNKLLYSSFYRQIDCPNVGYYSVSGLNIFDLTTDTIKKLDIGDAITFELSFKDNKIIFIDEVVSYSPKTGQRNKVEKD